MTLESTSVSVCFRGISRLPSAFVFLRWFKLAHISIQNLLIDSLLTPIVESTYLNLMSHESWLLTLALQGRLYRALHPKLYATRNLCMHDFLKFHHNCDAYMGVQKERKTTFLTAFEHREKRLGICLRLSGGRYFTGLAGILLLI